MGFYDELTNEQYAKLPRVAQGTIDRLRARVAELEADRETLLEARTSGPIYTPISRYLLDKGGREEIRVYTGSRQVVIEPDDGATYRVEALVEGGIEITMHGDHTKAMAVLPRVTNSVLVRAVDR